MQAVIVSGAPGSVSSHYARVLKEAGFVVAVDFGARICLDAGRMPDLVVGDLDSLDQVTLEHLDASGVPIERHPTEKDLTDLDLALRALRERGHEEAVLLNAFGGRLDHTLAVVASLSASADLFVWIDEEEVQGWLLSASRHPRLRLAGQGATVSIFALGGPAVLTTQGLEYGLSHESLDAFSSRGVSNRIVKQEAEVEVHSGKVLVLSPAHDGHPPARRLPT